MAFYVLTTDMKIDELCYIYILSNLALPRIYKIGFVKDDYVARSVKLGS